MLLICRPLSPSRQSERRKLEAEIREPGPRPVHREPHVSLQHVPVDIAKKQEEVSLLWVLRNLNTPELIMKKLSAPFLLLLYSAKRIKTCNFDYVLHALQKH